MINESQIKEKLQELAKNEFRLSENDDLSKLIPEMLYHIGSTDNYLRDDLIYSAIATWVLDHNAISHEQLREILQKILGDQHIFYSIGERDTDSVFRRSFSVLLLPLVLIAHRSQPFLSKTEIIQVKEKLIQYLKEEKDLRGFVSEKGWAHAIAHSADSLDDLAQCAEITEIDLREILAAIRAIISTYEVVYTHGEDERLVTATIAVIKRSLLPELEIAQWIRSFETPVLNTDSMPQGIMMRANIKNFLQSLYFRLDWEQMADRFAIPINQTLQKISLFAGQGGEQSAHS
ncbi:MAG: hypothetical protein UZ14_CFX002001549 [Chloroflexi bacterium OLB14]|nr:MAG: hypothetical protein UZ14_CFX002001549 [Chloroflexi bacterium OLB14]